MVTLAPDRLLDSLNIRFDRDVPLAPRTWYGLGGCASIMAHPASTSQMSSLAIRCHESDIPLRVLGSGANLLVADEGIGGVVVILDDPWFKQIRMHAGCVTVGAGYDLAKLVIQTAKAGLAGLQGLAGIPASIGGAVRMNAGGAFGEIGSSVRRVTVCDACGHIEALGRSVLEFGYRKTNIVAPTILEVEFELAADDPEQLVNQVKEVLALKKQSQPLRDSSAGCAFKNPTELPTSSEPSVSAGRLIDLAGLKGFCIGGAEVSSHHANFVIAHPGCTACDVRSILQAIEKKVLDQFGVQLEREVVCWP